METMEAVILWMDLQWTILIQTATVISINSNNKCLFQMEMVWTKIVIFLNNPHYSNNNKMDLN